MDHSARTVVAAQWDAPAPRISGDPVTRHVHAVDPSRCGAPDLPHGRHVDEDPVGDRVAFVGLRRSYLSPRQVAGRLGLEEAPAGDELEVVDEHGIAERAHRAEAGPLGQSSDEQSCPQ